MSASARSRLKKKKVSIPQTDLNDSVRSQGPSVVRLRAQQRANGPPCAGQVIAYVTWCDQDEDEDEASSRDSIQPPNPVGTVSLADW